MLTARLHLFNANLRLKLQKFNCVLAEYLEQSGVLKILELRRIMNYLTTFHVLSFSFNNQTYPDVPYSHVTIVCTGKQIQIFAIPFHL